MRFLFILGQDCKQELAYVTASYEQNHKQNLLAVSYQQWKSMILMIGKVYCIRRISDKNLLWTSTLSHPPKPVYTLRISLTLGDYVQWGLYGALLYISNPLSSVQENTHVLVASLGLELRACKCEQISLGYIGDDDVKVGVTPEVYLHMMYPGLPHFFNGFCHTQLLFCKNAELHVIPTVIRTGYALMW